MLCVVFVELDKVNRLSFQLRSVPNPNKASGWHQIKISGRDKIIILQPYGYLLQDIPLIGVASTCRFYHQ